MQTAVGCRHRARIEGAELRLEQMHIGLAVLLRMGFEVAQVAGAGEAAKLAS